MDENAVKEEFSGENVKKGLGRTALLIGAIILCFLSIIPVLGIITGAGAIALLTWGIKMNLKDSSGLKWLNIGLKVVFIIITLLFMIMGISLLF